MARVGVHAMGKRCFDARIEELDSAILLTLDVGEDTVEVFFHDGFEFYAFAKLSYLIEKFWSVPKAHGPVDAIEEECTRG